VGFYGDHIFPRVMNLVMANRHMREVRARVCDDLEGDVVELGFGTGLNLPHLPAEVCRLRAIEPSATAVRLASDRIAEADVPVEIAGLDGERLPLPDASVDAALSTWTLCTIPDPVAAIAEVRRVLRPGGTFHFVEHGRAPDGRVRRWQRRLNPVQRRLACGCHLDRDVPALLAEGGFEVERLDAYYAPAHPKPWGFTYEGVGRPR
jgi:ubiquinone/menaquinone biosynthesis C-methylase UbiE